MFNVVSLFLEINSCIISSLNLLQNSSSVLLLMYLKSFSDPKPADIFHASGYEASMFIIFSELDVMSATLVDLVATANNF
jgi:hypothetical protein